ncbi:hypothetical protein Psed_6747 (plasmid) [Pseudonocardia dioxanivorans CB1190]|uniref:TrbL/VirB6 plasmid conjugal transfer protein n=1 Tax=Pseudonocardia dioxanivorans (strain ATCC 55486 / DSM 44775 / JCM 13855 / CB1190) TaxID=675635 RepID=F2L6V6_PSEUX|nr:hypothetical protein [Pseudonocardia dioxanivorans]AEA28828.1 hypothetical protein Psed_6747 [Pseudonocardia dioxanivorans CB1190]GJF01678.1 hypothetical protein PSD17_06420 [Pseudonocardia sp. D17]
MPTSIIPNFPGLGDAFESAFNTILDSIMKAIWSASVWLLRTALELVDGLLAFNTNLAGADGKPAAGSPFSAVWPTLLWIAGAVALGLFFWQLAVTVLRGGVGFWRVASGPVAFGVACALSLGVVTVLLGGADGLTQLLLQKGLASDNFVGILDGAKLGQVFTDTPPDLGDQVDGSARSVVLGIVSVFGVIPAAIGYLLEMVFRQAVILVLVATLPITAAGLMTNTTSSWFWRALRWTIAAIVLKPALALVLVIGVNMLGQPSGIGGLLAGAGVLLVSLFCPLAVFRLLAFVEPGTAAGATFRSNLSAASGSGSSGSAGAAAGESSAEESNTSRFDAASSGSSGSSGGSSSGGSGGSGGGLSQLGGMVGGAAAAAASFGNAQMDGGGIGWGYGGPAGAGNSNSSNQNQDRSQRDPNSTNSSSSSSSGSSGADGSAPVDGGLPVSPDAPTQAIAPPTLGGAPAGVSGGPGGGSGGGPGGGSGGPGGGGAAAAADVPPVA